MVDETAKAFAAFAKYCALGPGRSLVKMVEVYQEYTKSIPLLKRWSSQHNWQDRVKIYDRERAEAQRSERDAAIEEMNARHIILAMKQQERAVAQIEALIAARAFGSQATVQLLKVTSDLERLARGAPTERSEQTGPNGTPLSIAQVVIWLPDNGRDGYAKGGGDTN